jgi:hypothetical protein
MLWKRVMIAPLMAAVETATALRHLDSVFCLTPMVEVHENGQEFVLHKEVTWN